MIVGGGFQGVPSPIQVRLSGGPHFTPLTMYEEHKNQDQAAFNIKAGISPQVTFAGLPCLARRVPSDVVGNCGAALYFEQHLRDYNCRNTDRGTSEGRLSPDFLSRIDVALTIAREIDDEAGHLQATTPQPVVIVPRVSGTGRTSPIHSSRLSIAVLAATEQ